MNRAPRKNATGPKGVGRILPREKLAPMAPRPPSRGGVLNPWRALAKARPPAVALRAACRDPGKLYATEFHPVTANPAELLQATRENPSHVGKDRTGATIVAPKRTLVTDRGKGAREGVDGSHGSAAYRNDRQQSKVGEPCAQMQIDSCGVRGRGLRGLKKRAERAERADRADAADGQPCQPSAAAAPFPTLAPAPPAPSPPPASAYGATRPVSFRLAAV